MAITLYKKQRKIYDFICQYIQKNEFAPTLKEIADAMNVRSVATVHEHLRSLEEKNLIRRNKGKNRSIELVNRTFVRLTEGVDLPITGFLSANYPITPNVRTDQNFRVSPELITGKKRAFILQVQGNELKEEMLTDEDYIILEEDQELEPGSIAVVVLDNGLAVIKKYFREATRLRLEPLYNEEAMPIYAGNVKIIGKVMGIIRKF